MENENYVDPEKMGWKRTVRLDNIFIKDRVVITTIQYNLESKAHCIHHRENGPAITAMFEKDDDFTQEWFLWGEKHRLDGPAVIRTCFNDYFTEHEWWIKGERLSPEKEKLLNTWYENHGE